MKPFNLERALKGDPVVTRKGLRVLHITAYRDYLSELVSVSAFIEKHNLLFFYNIDGKDENNKESSLDLFMAPVKKKLYIRVDNVESVDMSGNASHSTTNAYLSKEIIKENINSQIIEIEIDV